MEKTVKFLFKILLMLFSLFGVRYLLAIVGVIIPLEWFVIMIAGMIGFYGIILMVFYSVFINFW